MVSMHRAAVLAGALRLGDPTSLERVARMAWSDGGATMVAAVAERAGITLDQMIDIGGIRMHWDRAAANGRRRRRNGFHRPGARAEVRAAAGQLGRQWADHTGSRVGHGGGRQSAARTQAFGAIKGTER